MEMQHDKYAIINNNLWYFGKRTAEMCDETASSMEEALKIVMRLLIDGFSDLSIVEFIEVNGEMLANGREIHVRPNGDVEMFLED
jgi:roadblock/LC7 domain-containing protein